MDMYDIAVTQSARGALYDFFDVDIADVDTWMPQLAKASKNTGKDEYIDVERGSLYRDDQISPLPLGAAFNAARNSLQAAMQHRRNVIKEYKDRGLQSWYAVYRDRVEPTDLEYCAEWLQVRFGISHDVPIDKVLATIMPIKDVSAGNNQLESLILFLGMHDYSKLDPAWQEIEKAYETLRLLLDAITLEEGCTESCKPTWDVYHAYLTDTISSTACKRVFSDLELWTYSPFLPFSTNEIMPQKYIEALFRRDTAGTVDRLAWLKEVFRETTSQDSKEKTLEQWSVIASAYDIRNSFQLCFAFLDYIIYRKDLILRKCPKCGKYFVASTKKKRYCDFLHANGKTCGQLAKEESDANRSGENGKYRNVLRRLDAQGDSYREKAEIIRAKGKNSSPKELEKLQQLQEAIEDINNQRDALQLERKKKVKDLSPEEYQNWQTNIDKAVPKKRRGRPSKSK